eukprot:1161078-Pelagomonas_calceolata.AAC.24
MSHVLSLKPELASVLKAASVSVLLLKSLFYSPVVCTLFSHSITTYPKRVAIPSPSVLKSSTSKLYFAHLSNLQIKDIHIGWLMSDAGRAQVARLMQDLPCLQEIELVRTAVPKCNEAIPMIWDADFLKLV